MGFRLQGHWTKIQNSQRRISQQSFCRMTSIKSNLIEVELTNRIRKVEKKLIEYSKCDKEKQFCLQQDWTYFSVHDRDWVNQRQFYEICSLFFLWYSPMVSGYRPFGRYVNEELLRVQRDRSLKKWHTGFCSFNSHQLVRWLILKIFHRSS